MREKLYPIFILVAWLLLPTSVFAQGTTYTTPRTVPSTVATNLACTGSPQTFSTATPALNALGFRNVGQTQHYAFAKTNAAVTTLVMQIQGLDQNGNVSIISDTGMTALTAGANSALTGSGSFANIQLIVTCFPASTGTFTLFYSGTSATSNQIVGSYLIAQQDKEIASGASAGTSLNIPLFPTPFGSSLGSIVFQYNGAGPALSAFSVSCQTQGGTGYPQPQFALATTSGLAQVFNVPPGPCPVILLQYLSGGASASTYTLDYVFIPPGTTVTNSYTHVTGMTATVIKAGPGIVHSLVVGTSAAGTIKLFDLVAESCTGTPSTNVVSTITEFLSATSPPPSYIFDTLFLNGICVQASAAMDITIGSQ